MSPSLGPYFAQEIRYHNLTAKCKLQTRLHATSDLEVSPSKAYIDQLAECTLATNLASESHRNLISTLHKNSLKVTPVTVTQYKVMWLQRHFLDFPNGLFYSKQCLDIVTQYGTV